MPQSAQIQRALKLRQDVLVPQAKKLKVELIPEVSLSHPPMVLLLGNHSSGKSSFINHLLGEDVQRTGVAPTDDHFTILMQGDEVKTLDGQSLSTDPHLPFEELQSFGPGLVQHLEAKVLKCEVLEKIHLIDSPGMIDTVGQGRARPYDFNGTIKWFAEHADCILLFFDPEKPGTTGETLAVLTQSLSGMDHKLRIVMNKMDLFDDIRDFSRTYGALCWNLSRHLNTKDIPHIYTTVIPKLEREDCRLDVEGFRLAMKELEEHLMNLPKQRVDSVLNRLLAEAKGMKLNLEALRSIKKTCRRVWRKHFALSFAALGCGGVISSLMLDLDSRPLHLGLMIAMGVGSLLLSFFWASWRFRSRLKSFQDGSDKSFLDFKDPNVRGGRDDESLKQLWHTTERDFYRSLTPESVSKFKWSTSDRTKLQQMVDVDLPNCRHETDEAISVKESQREV